MALPVPTSPFSLLLIAGTGLVLVGSVVVAGRELLIAYRVFSTPTARVSDLLTDADRTVELHGTARVADRTLAGPFTGEDCLVVETVVEEYESSGGGGGSWTEIDSVVQSVPFVLEDDSGSVLVDPRMADTRLSEEAEITVDGGTTPPERIERYIEENDEVSYENRRLDLKLFSVPVGADRRYTETRLRPGGEVYVFGRARPEAGSADTINAVIGYGADAPMFLLSDGSARRTGWRVLARGALYLVPGVVVAGIALVVLVA